MDLVLAGSSQRGLSSRRPSPGSVRCLCWASEPWQVKTEQTQRESSSCPPQKHRCSVCQWVSCIHSLHSMQRIRTSASRKQLRRRQLTETSFVPLYQKYCTLSLLSDCWLFSIQYKCFSKRCSRNAVCVTTNSQTSSRATSFPVVPHHKILGSEPCCNHLNKLKKKDPGAFSG